MNPTENVKSGCLPHLVRCKCSLRDKVLGDGCSICNPELTAELRWNSTADKYNQWDNLGSDEQDELIAAEIAALSPMNVTIHLTAQLNIALTREECEGKDLAEIILKLYDDTTSIVEEAHKVEITDAYFNP